jgi:hypothetical protein
VSVRSTLAGRQLNIVVDKSVSEPSLVKKDSIFRAELHCHTGNSFSTLTWSLPDQ